jgi:hypothetical protein
MFPAGRTARNPLARSLWLSLSKQWIDMADEAEPGPLPVPTFDLAKLAAVLEQPE